MRIPKDNFPDEYESRAFQEYQESFRPGLLLRVREMSRNMLFAGMVFTFAALGLSVAWITLPPAEPRIIIVTPAYTPSPIGDIQGDFPPDVPQQFIIVPAKIDHELFAGQRHGYRFFLEPGITWLFTVTPDETFDPMMTLYGPDGLVLQLNDDILQSDFRSQISFTPTQSGQYGLLIESTDDRQTSGGYTLTIMPVR